ncbi:rhodanese-like domain-containing protein [Mariniflexile sp.]|uniref:rhodanese-like domain-containing protein n=1 Tax=Mariniflexile sp. TaxID=1979402 RepID=UPI0035646C29
MKEMEKIQRISIVSILFILAVIIGLLTYKRPKNTFTINTKPSLEKLTSENFFVSLENGNVSNYQLIDIRNVYEFEKGHLNNAINIPTPDILDTENLQIFKQLKNKNKTAVLYGENPQEVNPVFLILYQMGYDNIKILKAENSYSQNKLITKNCEIENYEKDITAFINESVKAAEVIPEKIKKVAPPVKKIIILEQKKKKAPEGGC